MTEIELQLRLDAEGRTALESPDTLHSISETDLNDQTKKRKIHDEDNDPPSGEKSKITSDIDYSSKTTFTALSNCSKVPLFGPGDEDKKIDFLDELRFDCEIADCALLPRTFWLPAKGIKPRCALEQCALEVFHHHVKQGFAYDEERSGCEWWVQIRPSPPSGRYTILCNHGDNNSNNEKKHGNTDVNKDCKNNLKDLQPTTSNGNKTPVTDIKATSDGDLEKKGICFHWDKDEDLRLMMDGKMYIHPHISTVSYLSDIGAPTMALNYRVNPLTGEYMSPPTTNPVESYISWPKLGKHLSFDGRYLHAAPYDLMEKGLFERQTDATWDLQGVVDGTERRKIQRRHRRVTFLVNIWLNYKPFNVDLFPETMIGKLSKPVDTHILFDKDKTGNNHNTIPCVSNETEGNLEEYSYNGTKAKATPKGHDNDDLVDFQWSLGNGPEERLEIQLPLKSIQRKIGTGGDVNLVYECQSEIERAVRLVKEPITTTSV